MDLKLYWDALRRRRKLVVGGIVLAVLLSVLSYVRVDLSPIPKLEYRQPQTWESSASILLTQPGFPQGRSIFPSRGPFADPSRFVSLASVYANLATSDDVKRQIRRKGPVPGFFFALPTIDRVANNTPLPIINTFGHASSASGAVETVRRGTEALIQYIRVRQVEARIPENQRVYLEVASSPSAPQVVLTRKKTLPVFVLLAVLSATLILAFVLENLQQAQKTPEVQGARASQDLLPRPEPAEVGVLHAEHEPVEVEVLHPEPEPQVVETKVPEVRRWA